MRYLVKRYVPVVSAMIILVSCGQNKTTLEPDSVGKDASEGYRTDVFNDPSKSKSESDHDASHREVHVLDMLEGERYQYLQVRMADGSETWLATRKGPFEIGGHYVFHQGLYKTDYHSTEFDRTFEEIYLVSDLKAEGAESGSGTMTTPSAIEVEKPAEAVDMAKGSISIKELITHSDEYIGKEVQVTGKVVKVNPNIMDRNWVHLADGTMNSFDFVLTTTASIPTGHELTFTGTFRADRDFGAGYRYDFILEDARLTQ